MLSQALEDDSWLGNIAKFPTVLHARASLVYDVTNETLQKTLVHCLFQLQQSIRPIELSLSDIAGYLDGTVRFRIGVGSNDGFDILDANEEDRVLRRILSHGVFQTLDLSFDLQYKVKSSRKHRVAHDRYLARLTFQTGRAELLVHHLKGLKRVDPGEMVRLLLEITNAELLSKGYGEIAMEESRTN
jgi:hypothetical protein